MTRQELIKLIGDVITRLDILRGGLLPEDPRRHVLDLLRNDLDGRQLQLVKNAFDENTPVFQSATEQLKSINSDLKQTLNDINALATTLNNLQRFVSAVDNIVGVALGVFA
jgi:hypothetical protein